MPQSNKVRFIFLVLWVVTTAKFNHGYPKNEEMDSSGDLVSFVKEPTPSGGNPLPIVNVEHGNDFIIGCSLKNVEDNVSIYWEVRHPNRLVTITSSSRPVPENGDKYEVDSLSSNDDDFKDTSILTVSSAVSKDGGIYFCYMFYEGRKIEAKVPVFIKGPPTLKIYEHLVYAAEGETVRLMCTVMSSMETQVEWYRNSQKLLNATENRIFRYMYRKRDYVDHQLVIMSTSVKDRGNYTCVGTNEQGASKGKIHLQVKSAESFPLMTKSPSSDVTKSVTIVMPQYSRITVQSTGSVRICCSATHFSSNAEMRWEITSVTGNKLQLEPTDEFFYKDVMMRTYEVTNTSGTFYSLAMDTLAFNFTGSYSCILKESGQTFSDQVDINVIGPPIATAKVTEMNGLLGEKIVLTCDVWSSPQPTLLKWYFEDKIISSSQRLVETEFYHNTVHFDMILTITELRATDFGVYSCKVYNNRGNTLAVQVIQDLDECSFPDTNPCNNSVCVNQLGSVRCQCDQGYALVPGNNHFCQDIDECSSIEPCDHVCTNTIGSYMCKCKDGYVQSGNNCRMIVEPVTPVTDAPGGRGDNEDEEHTDLDTLYSVIGAIAGALLVTLLIILVFMWCRRSRMDNESITMKDRFMDNVAYQSSGDSKIRLNSFMSEMNKSVLPRDEFPRQRLQLGIDLGQGRFGKVMMARALNINGNSEWEMVAVKTCKDCAMDCEKVDLYQELEIMRKIPHHPNIVDYLGCCTQQDPVYIIMEYVSGSNLQQHLRKFRPSQLATTSEELEPLSTKDLNTYALHVSRGMEHLAKLGIIHRDLAARNVLVGGTKVCKICDFGLARNVEGSDVYERSSKGPQPIRWMAPEGLADQCFTKKSDVWSYGVLLWELVTLGATPYPGMSAREVIATVMMGKWLSRPFHCKQEMYSLMVQCWDMEPMNRPTFLEISHTIETLLEREAEYIELTEYKEGAFSDLDPNLVDERV